MAEITSTYSRGAAYRYIRETDKLPRDIASNRRFDKVSCPVRLFNPTGAGTWWIASYDPETDIACCVADIHEREWGSVFMAELADYRGQMGLPIERDLHYAPKTVAQILAGEGD